MARKEISLKTVNGDILFGYAWECPQPKGCVFIATGMEEHCLRYDDFANYLTNNGYNVYSIDHYGQGLNVVNDGEYGIVPRSFFSKSVRNLDDLVKKYSIKGLPIIVMGHSMGSFMIQDYIQRYAKRPTKAIIMSSNGKNGNFSYQIGYPLARLICKIKGENKRAKLLEALSVGAYSKAVKNRKTPCDWLSFNEENVRNYLADPRCGYGSSNGFYRELLKGNHRLYKCKFLAKVNKDLKIYIVAGDKDPVGANGKGPKSLYKMYTKLGIKDVELKLYENMRHEILNEDKKQDVYEDILNFIQK